jgi:uncharacterized phage-associated protein
MVKSAIVKAQYSVFGRRRHGERKFGGVLISGERMQFGRVLHCTWRIGSGIISGTGRFLFGRVIVVPGRGGGMYFHFGTKKIIEAAGVLLQCRAERRMSYLRLLKLLYIADRESLEETGRPIIGTRPVAMDHGCVHSDILNWINGRLRDSAKWSKFIRTEDYDVVLAADPGQLALSQYDIEKLQEVYNRYQGLTRFQLADLTHEFPEWKKNYSQGTSQTIPLSDIIEAVGRKSEEEDIAHDAARQTKLRRFFGSVA